MFYKGYLQSCYFGKTSTYIYKHLNHDDTFKIYIVDLQMYEAGMFHHN